MNKLVMALVSFAGVFVCVFVLSGWYVTPYMPAMPDIPSTIREPAFWTSNWPGVILGVLLGLISAKSVFFTKKKKAR